MKKSLKAIFVSMCLLMSMHASSQFFTLTWSEEFNTGNNVLPDATNWGNEVGVIRNGEWQYYTDRDIDNQVLKDGNLLIIGKKEDFGGKQYTSASLTSKLSWKYGKIESRFKMQTGMGMWPCFWTLGENARSKGNTWPQCGEIDILEHINSEIPYHGTIHWWDESITKTDKHVADGGTFPVPAGSYDPNNYNVYGIEWTPSYIKWYVNDVTVKTVSTLNGINGMYEFHEPHFILLDCPIGGSWPTVMPGFDAAKIPVVDTMFVDYVKVYSYNSDAPAAPLSLASSTVTQSSFNLSWAASAGATAYDVIIDNNGTIQTYGPFNSTSCSITGLTAGTTYAARVKSRNAETNSSEMSEMSKPFYITTSANIPPIPLVSMQLNENSGTTTVNSGSAGGTFSLKGTAKWSANIPANNNSGTSAIEIATNGEAVESSDLLNHLIGLNDITITGWINCKNATEIESAGRRIACNINAQWYDATKGTNGFDLVSRADGSFQIGINEAAKSTSPRSSAGKMTVDATAGASNWTYFAVTYSAAAKSVSFYFGNSAATATLDKTITCDKGVMGPFIGPLAIGNFNSITRAWQPNRMFVGLIDQIQIYNSSLNLPQIVTVQNLRSTATNNVNFDSHKVTIYQSPTKDNLTISLKQFNESETIQVSIFNLKGTLLYSDVRIGNGAINIPLVKYSGGVYLVKIQSGVENIIRKFIVAE